MVELNVRLGENLRVGLQPWPGAFQQQEQLLSATESTLPGEAPDLAIFGFLGDIRLRFLFVAQDDTLPIVARVSDLERLDLTPARAVALAIANLKRAEKAPQLEPMGDGIYNVRAARPGSAPCYVLDGSFWTAQLERFPAGLIVAVPRSGVLILAPIGDVRVEQEFNRRASQIALRAGSNSLSSCIYLFNARGWSVRGRLQAVPLVARATIGERAGEDQSGASIDDISPDLAMAAQGRKMLICSVFLTLALYSAIGKPKSAIEALFVLWMLSSGLGLVGVVRLGVGLSNRTGLIVTTMVLNFFPVVNMITWSTLNVQATRALRAAGWRLGLLGARPPGS